MLTVPFIAFLAGFGWACFGIMISGLMKSFENFNYVVSGVLTPMMLTAGTFFPLTTLPEWAQVLGNFNPLHHCVELVRHAAFGWDPGADLLHLAALVVLRGRDVAHRRLGDDAQARDLAGLTLLLGRADQHLVDRDAARAGHDVGDRVGDVAGLHRLVVPDALSQDVA